MRGMSLILIVIFLGLPALWYVPAMMWGFQITNASMSDSPEAAEDMADLIGGPAPVKWFGDRNEFRRYYSADALSERRRVAVEVTMQMEDLLAPGEALPDPALHELYARSRAASFLIQRCPEILGEFATTCDVGNNQGSILRDGRVSIKGSLLYLPNYEIGDLSTVENGHILTSGLGIVDRRDNLADTPENRAEAVRQALLVCDLVKAKFGNCLISNLTLSQRRPRPRDDDQTIRMTASATVAVFADKTLYRRESFREEINRIEEVMMN